MSQVSSSTPEDKCSPLEGYSRAKTVIPGTRASFLASANLGDHLVVKDTWLTFTKADDEHEILSGNQGLWGIPELLAAYPIHMPYQEVLCPENAIWGCVMSKEHVEQEHRQEEEDSIGQVISQNPNSLVDSNSGDTVVPENLPPMRKCMRLVFKTRGASLLTLSSNYDILETIIHAIVGMYFIVWLQGVLVIEILYRAS